MHQIALTYISDAVQCYEIVKGWFKFYRTSLHCELLIFWLPRFPIYLTNPIVIMYLIECHSKTILLPVCSFFMFVVGTYFYICYNFYITFLDFIIIYTYTYMYIIRIHIQFNSNFFVYPTRTFWVYSWIVNNTH